MGADSKSAHRKSFLVFGESFKPIFVLLLAYGAMVQNAVVEEVGNGNHGLVSGGDPNFAFVHGVEVLGVVLHHRPLQCLESSVDGGADQNTRNLRFIGRVLYLVFNHGRNVLKGHAVGA